VKKLNNTSNLKELVLTTGYLNTRAITETTKTLKENVILDMPKFKSMVDKCTRLRNKKFQIFGLKFDDIPDFCKRDLQNEVFMHYDCRCDSISRYIKLYSEINMKFFKSVKTVMNDGTFWVFPILLNS
jgi:hypothetical protein